MKKILAIVFGVCLLALLCACGEKDEPAAPAPAASEAQMQEEEKPEATEAEETKAEASAPTEEPKSEPPVEEPADEPAEPTLLDTALTFVDKDASELVAAVGEPMDKSYEESCSGPGEDGIWTYDGLTVFTYKENGVETIVDAE